MARQRNFHLNAKHSLINSLQTISLKMQKDIQDMPEDLLGDTLQGMLEAEMDQQLGYSNTITRTRIRMTAATASARRP